MSTLRFQVFHTILTAFLYAHMLSDYSSKFFQEDVAASLLDWGLAVPNSIFLKQGKSTAQERVLCHMPYCHMHSFQCVLEQRSFVI